MPHSKPINMYFTSYSYEVLGFDRTKHKKHINQSAFSVCTTFILHNSLTTMFLIFLITIVDFQMQHRGTI